jgi:protein gp37
VADGTGIEWTDATWNPLVGCTKVSPGCDHCYAETLVNRFAGHNVAFPNSFDVVTMRDERMLTQPLRWKRPRRVFVNSLSDLFHADVPDEFIAQVFAVMAASPQHTFQLLTKRHARMRAFLRDVCRCGAGHPPGVHLGTAMAWAVSRANPDRIPGDFDEASLRESPWPLPNVWLGVSVENQQWADIRIPALLDTPAAVRWISAEPLLGPIKLRASWVPLRGAVHLDGARVLDWVVVGGESGPGARPMHPQWARDLRDQCAVAEVPFLFKQWGAWSLGASVRPGERRAIVSPDGPHTRVEPDVQVRQSWIFGSALMKHVGKKSAGRELDGRTHDGYPAART